MIKRMVQWMMDGQMDGEAIRNGEDGREMIAMRLELASGLGMNGCWYSSALKRLIYESQRGPKECMPFSLQPAMSSALPAGLEVMRTTESRVISVRFDCSY